MLKLISGYLKVIEGEILLNGKSIYSYKPAETARKIAFVPQSYDVVFPYSVYEMVAMGRHPWLGLTGFEKESDHEIVKQAIEFTGMKGLEEKGINEVSGGEAQRALIARALAQEPDILLLDEPNSHLDLHHQISVMNLLKELNSNSEITIIMVSHDLNISASYTERIIVLQEGLVKLDGPTSRVLNKDNIKKIFQVESEIFNPNKDANFNILILPG